MNIYTEELADQKRTRIDHARMLVRFKNVFGTDEGKLVFFQILVNCGFLQSIWDKSGMDIHYKAARNDVCLELISLMTEASPELCSEILTMGLKERADEMRRESELLIRSIYE